MVLLSSLSLIVKLFTDWNQSYAKIERILSQSQIFHCRMAHDDLIKELKNCQLRIKGVLHGFVGTTKQLQGYLKMGFYIGFNGIIFKKIEGINFEENIKATPLERILIETDCPYLAPPQVKKFPNEPIFVQYVAEEIAKVKNLSFEKLAEITTENAIRFFNLY